MSLTRQAGPAFQFNDVAAQELVDEQGLRHHNAELYGRSNNGDGDDERVVEEARFKDALTKMTSGLSELVTRLNQRFGKFENDVNGSYLMDMTAETEKQIEADSDLQREITDKIQKLELAVEQALVEAEDEWTSHEDEASADCYSSSEVSEEIFKSVDRSVESDDDWSDATRSSTNRSGSHNEFVKFNDATTKAQNAHEARSVLHRYQVLRPPPSIRRPQYPNAQCSSRQPVLLNRIVSPDGNFSSARFNAATINGGHVATPAPSAFSYDPGFRYQPNVCYYAAVQPFGYQQQFFYPIFQYPYPFVYGNFPFSL